MANPTAHPHQPYLLYTPLHKPALQNPSEHVNLFDSWSQRAEGICRNIWHNLRTGASVSGAAWGKLNLATKAISKGGLDSLFRQSFPTEPNEKLKKTFACYLSTINGPVSGTLYLSTARVAFCSDRPLSFTPPTGQQTWSYYKVSIPTGNIEKINLPEKYIHIMTIDGHEFWFMGFVNFDKASHYLSDSISGSRAASNAAHRVLIS